jgi:hypothetical protein
MASEASMSFVALALQARSSFARDVGRHVADREEQRRGGEVGGSM